MTETHSHIVDDSFLSTDFDYDNLTKEEQRIVHAAISTALRSKNSDEADRLSKNVPLGPRMQKVFTLVYGEAWIKEQGYLVKEYS